MEETNVVVEPVQEGMPKKKGIAILLCLFGGILGAHKLYEGKYIMGVLYLLTVGFCFIGVIIDLIKLLGKPSVYYVVKKQFTFNPEQILESIKNIPVDRIGVIISCIGGGIIGLGASIEFKWSLMLIGLAVGVVGAVISFLKRRDLMETLRINGITIGISAVAVFAFLLLVAAVIIWVLVKLFLGVDILQWLLDVFGTDKKKEIEQGNGDGIFTTLSMPDVITGPYGNLYYRESSGVDCSVYTSKHGDRATIYNSQIEVSAAGMYADTSDGHFFW